MLSRSYPVTDRRQRRSPTRLGAPTQLVLVTQRRSGNAQRIAVFTPSPSAKESLYTAPARLIQLAELIHGTCADVEAAAFNERSEVAEEDARKRSTPNLQVWRSNFASREKTEKERREERDDRRPPPPDTDNERANKGLIYLRGIC